MLNLVYIESKLLNITYYYITKNNFGAILKYLEVYNILLIKTKIKKTFFEYNITIVIYFYLTA